MLGAIYGVTYSLLLASAVITTRLCFSPIDGRRDEVLRAEGSIRAEAAVSRGQEPAVLAPGDERRPVLRDGAAVHRRAAVDLHHGRRVSQQQHSSYP